MRAASVALSFILVCAVHAPISPAHAAKPSRVKASPVSNGSGSRVAPKKLRRTRNLFNALKGGLLKITKATSTKPTGTKPTGNVSNKKAAPRFKVAKKALVLPVLGAALVASGCATTRTNDAAHIQNPTRIEQVQLKVRDLVKKRIHDEAHKERKATLYEIKIPRASLAFNAKGQWLPKDHPLAKDPVRAQYTKGKKEAGQPVEWGVMAGGAVLNTGVSLPLLQGVSANVGAGGTVLVTRVDPYPRNVKSAGKQALRNLKPPLSEKDLKKTMARMETGSEISLAFNGHINGGVGVGVGQSRNFLRDLFKVGTSAGASISGSGYGSYAVTYKKLGEDKFFVTIKTVDGLGIRFNASARVGATVDSQKASGLQPSGKLYETGASMVFGAVDSTARKYLTAGANVSATSDRRHTVIKAGVLNTKSGKFRNATMDEVAKPSTLRVSANVGPAEILNRVNNASKAKVELVGPDGNLLMKVYRVDFNRARDGIISGNTQAGAVKMGRRFYVVEKPGLKPSIVYNVYSTRESDAFLIPIKGKLNEFVATAQILGLQPQMKKHQIKKTVKYLNKKGKATFSFNVSLTPEGIKRLKAASESRLMSAWAAAYKEIRGTKWVPDPANERRESTVQLVLALARADNPQAQIDVMKSKGRALSLDPKVGLGMLAIVAGPGNVFGEMSVAGKGRSLDWKSGGNPYTNPQIAINNVLYEGRNGP